MTPAKEFRIYVATWVSMWLRRCAYDMLQEGDTEGAAQAGRLALLVGKTFGVGEVATCPAELDEIDAPRVKAARFWQESGE